MSRVQADQHRACEDSEVLSLRRDAARLRLCAFDQVTAAGHGHLGSTMSCAELVAAAHRVLELPAEGTDGRDVLVLSKGHAAPMLYAALTDCQEGIPFAQAGSRFPAHPNAVLTPEVTVSTGSVGMGLAVALGIAAGLELQRRTGRVVVIAGDGEMQSGMIWEALLNLAARPHLPILFVVDANGYQGQMPVRSNEPVRRMLQGVAPEFRDIDGNDPAAVLDLMRDFAGTPRALVVWARTRRGAGIPVLEQHPLPMTWRPPEEDVAGIRAALQAAICS